MLSVKGVYQNGQIKFAETIDIEKEIPVIITFLEDVEVEDEEKNRYQFSDLAGRLEWDGDPVTQQRALRDEW